MSTLPFRAPICPPLRNACFRCEGTGQFNIAAPYDRVMVICPACGGKGGHPETIARIADANVRAREEFQKLPWLVGLRRELASLKAEAATLRQQADAQAAIIRTLQARLDDQSGAASA